MTAITNKLNIKYRPWKIYAFKDGTKNVWAETTETAATKRQSEIQNDGWKDITVIEGKEIETEAA